MSTGLDSGILLTLFTPAQEYRLGDPLGRGSEGTVYEVRNEAQAVELALKWYHPDQAFPSRYSTLNHLVRRGAPGTDFLWPRAVIGSDNQSQFGYVMDYRPSDFVELGSLIQTRAAGEERRYASACFALSRAMHQLHAAGLCYQDLNMGNVFVRPSDGAVLVCDNDNVSVDGRIEGAVAATPRFKAPELVRNEVLPSIDTDRFSMAVLLFHMMVVAHPLEGIRTHNALADDEAHLRFHGEEPIFCFDPNDDRNRPDPNVDEHVVAFWSALPRRVRTLFEQSFTAGLNAPQQRVGDLEWCEAFGTLLDSIIFCVGEDCQDIRYLDVDSPFEPCVWCDYQLKHIDVLEAPLTKSRIVMSPQNQLTKRHLAHTLDDAPVGTVVKSDGTVMHLQNTYASTWRSHAPGGAVMDVAPGSVVELSPGTKLEIDGTQLNVRRIERPS